MFDELLLLSVACQIYFCNIKIIRQLVFLIFIVLWFNDDFPFEYFSSVVVEIFNAIQHICLFSPILEHRFCWYSSFFCMYFDRHF